MDSQLRYNAMIGEWVLFSPRRHDSKKPNDFASKQKRPTVAKRACAFENPQASGNAEPYFTYPSGKQVKHWKVQVLSNKFPALDHTVDQQVPSVRDSSLFHNVVSGYGYHDLLIVKDHTKHLGQYDINSLMVVFQALIERYKQISGDDKISYISMFQNWGQSAGASIAHPHCQIIGLPVLPKHIVRSLHFSQKYHQEKGRCMMCEMIHDELKHAERIIYKTDHAIAFIPYAAQEPFEIIIAPRIHGPYIEQMRDSYVKATVDVFRHALLIVRTTLKDPDYNWYINTAPVSYVDEYPYYHWHIRLVPRSNISAGLELNTGIEMNPIFPEEAVKILKKKK